jgi:hypothetical protein
MKRSLVAGVAAALAGAACGDGAGAAPTAKLPIGWLCGATGGGSPKWELQADAAGAQQLKQTGRAPFPWCVRPDTKLADGFVEVRFKALAGKEDQAGGLVWRWQDGDNYYVARANALENNVSLYYTQGGSRRTLKYVDAPVPGNTWHKLRVEFQGEHIQVYLNGSRYIDYQDSHITAAGSVGVWTKADSVTLFDAFQWGETTPTKP